MIVKTAQGLEFVYHNKKKESPSEESKGEATGQEDSEKNNSVVKEVTR